MALSVASESTARAAWAWVETDELVSHVISGGIPPSLAIATWFAAESEVKDEHVEAAIGKRL